MNVFTDPEVIYTRADSPFKTLEDVIEHAKKRAQALGRRQPGLARAPGCLEQLKTAAGVNAAIVTHEGGGDMMINVLNGTLDIGIGEIQELRSQLEASKIRLLATFNPEPHGRFARRADGQGAAASTWCCEVPRPRRPEGSAGDDIAASGTKAIPKVLADPEYKKAYTGSRACVPNFIGHMRISGRSSTTSSTKTEDVPEGQPASSSRAWRRAGGERVRSRSSCRGPRDEQGSCRRRCSAGLSRRLFLVDAADPGKHRWTMPSARAACRRCWRCCLPCWRRSHRSRPSRACAARAAAADAKAPVDDDDARPARRRSARALGLLADRRRLSC